MPRALLRIAVLLTCSLVLASGCATVQTVSPSNLHGQQLSPGVGPVAHVYADCWGIYLFKVIPLVTGNIQETGLGLPFLLFSNSVRVDALVERVSREAQQRGGTLLTDLQTRDRSYWMPWTLFFWLNEFEVSANASAVSH